MLDKSYRLRGKLTKRTIRGGVINHEDLLHWMGLIGYRLQRPLNHLFIVKGMNITENPHVPGDIMLKPVDVQDGECPEHRGRWFINFDDNRRSYGQAAEAMGVTEVIGQVCEHGESVTSKGLGMVVSGFPNRPLACESLA